MAHSGPEWPLCAININLNISESCCCVQRVNTPVDCFPLPPAPWSRPRSLQGCWPSTRRWQWPHQEKRSELWSRTFEIEGIGLHSTSTTRCCLYKVPVCSGSKVGCCWSWGHTPKMAPQIGAEWLWTTGVDSLKVRLPSRGRFSAWQT